MMRVLVAGIGNIFLGDDGFGSEVARRLVSRGLPDNVEVVDFGIRGIDLGYALLEAYDVVILIDAMQRGGVPGSVYLVEPDLDEVATDDALEHESFTPHALDPATVLRYVAALGGQRPRLLLVACEPKSLGGEEGFMGLSEPVTAGVAAAVQMIEELLAQRCTISIPANSGVLLRQPTEPGYFHPREVI
jgi:hydrogenase maturation protease